MLLAICERHFAARLLDDPVADAQAEPRSFSNGLRRVERIERAIQIAESSAGILDVDRDPATLTRSRNANLPRLADLDGVNCVVQNIEEHLLQIVVADG